MDKNGRIFGKVSVVDIIIVLAVLVLGAGLAYRQLSREVRQIVSADAVFYVTLESKQLRGFSVDAVSVGDVMYKQHDRQSLGVVKEIKVAPGVDYLLKSDGTAVLAEMEERYTAFITLECRGNINETGYFVNGNTHIAEGSEVVLVSNRVFIPNTSVYRIFEGD